MRYKLYFGNPDCPEIGATLEIQASSTEEAWAKGEATPPPNELLGLEDVFRLEEETPHLSRTTREEWRSVRTSGAGLTTVRYRR
jgi:hypothetical protein